MDAYISAHRSGFGPGLTVITRHDDAGEPTQIGLAVLKLAAGERHAQTTTEETAWLLMSGRVKVKVGGKEATFSRDSLFDESPSCIHVAAGTRVEITAETPVEWTVYRSANTRNFAPRLFFPEDTADEPRGKGQVGGACLRLVRTIFDGRNSEANAELVLGEVVTLPGRWSSYPPHHHAQPEIYHYRFDHPQGYGHAELGEAVYKVRANDTLRILEGRDHAQCAAPGYSMYYAWVIRHLQGNPYTLPEFTAEHRWTMEQGAPVWSPKGIRDDA